MRSGLGLVLVALAGCNPVLGLKQVTHDARTPDVAADGDDVPRSCQALHLAHPEGTSGAYMIDPDGPGGMPPQNVICDMTTAGGGWTIVFVPSSTNLTAAPIPYTTSVPSLMDSAQDVLMVYRHATMAAYAGAATFPLPTDWRTSSPFSYQATDVPILVSIDGATATAKTLRYGQQTFSTLCGDPWVANPLYGRVCIQGTTAPLYSAFVYPAGDWCADSGAAFNSTPCSADRQFSIAVR